MVEYYLAVRRVPSLVDPVVSAMPAFEKILDDAEDSDENQLEDAIALPKAIREPHQVHSLASTDAQCAVGSEYSRQGVCTGQLGRLGHHKTWSRHLTRQSHGRLNPASFDTICLRDKVGDYRAHLRGGLADPTSLHPTPDHPPSLRTRLSRLFHSKRGPKGEKPLKLQDRMPQAQEPGQAQCTWLFVERLTDIWVTGTADHSQSPCAPPLTQVQIAEIMRSSPSRPSTPTMPRSRQSEPRFIGLEDRLAKEALAVPTSVRRVDGQIPTDQTMATRGSGSSMLHNEGRPRTSATVQGGNVDAQTRGTSLASMLVHVGDKKERGLGARIKNKTKQLFGLGKKKDQ
ncbi:MAG: hypothetical protein Q9208_008064 [Pyrenodesmia sp. 3 TL-2023]